MYACMYSIIYLFIHICMYACVDSFEDCRPVVIMHTRKQNRIRISNKRSFVRSYIRFLAYAATPLALRHVSSPRASFPPF